MFFYSTRKVYLIKSNCAIDRLMDLCLQIDFLLICYMSIKCVLDSSFNTLRQTQFDCKTEIYEMLFASTNKRKEFYIFSAKSFREGHRIEFRP